MRGNWSQRAGISLNGRGAGRAGKADCGSELSMFIDHSLHLSILRTQIQEPNRHGENRDQRAEADVEDLQVARHASGGADHEDFHEFEKQDDDSGGGGEEQRILAAAGQQDSGKESAAANEKEEGETGDSVI